VAVTEGAGPPHPLARPFLGTGVVGGFTTFSTYAVEVDRLLSSGAAALALAYLFGTVAAALVAVQVGVTTARAVLRARGRDRGGRRTA
jgi:CrcB protein